MNDQVLSIEVTSRGLLAGPGPAVAPVDESLSPEARVPAREPVDLRLDTLKAWLSPCDELDRVVLTGPGEPLLHPRIAYLVRVARQYGASCVIETGGRVLEGRLVRDLVEAGLDELWVRLDAPSREGYLAVRGDDGFDAVIRNLAAAADERSMLLARNPVVRVLFVAGAPGTAPDAFRRGLPPRQVERLRVIPGEAARAPGPYVSVTGDVYAWGPAPLARDLADLPRLGAAADRPLTAWDVPPPPAPCGAEAPAAVAGAAEEPAPTPADAPPEEPTA